MNQKYAQTNPYAYYGTSYPGQGYAAQQPAYNPYAQAGGPLISPGTPPTFNQQNPAEIVPGMLPLEQSYIENILRLNKGKLATVYMTFENNREWNAKVFKGIIEAAGRDHIILSDPQTGMRYLLLMIYLDYVTFDEELEYEYPYGAAAAQPMATYSPR
jgi:spore germination protein Q